MDIQFGSEVILSYQRLSYTPWHALAEFVDNATQAYFSNREVLDERYNIEETSLTVNIDFSFSGTNNFISIADNSIGMDLTILENALTVGLPPTNTHGRSKYGLGMKTASFWFGQKWTITTKRLNHPKKYKVVLEAAKIATGSLSLEFHETDAPLEEHGTTVVIELLNRTIKGKSVTKVKNYLQSMYRMDLSSGTLKLNLRGEPLTWDYDNLFSKIANNPQDGTPYKTDFDFEINGKRVNGWAGVLFRGSRSQAGFSQLQYNRVIKGWPDSYRPETLFGTQEGGSNNLVNQRLFGEIFMDDFDVSHTKDSILFSDDEEEQLEFKLLEELAHLKNAAETLRHTEDLDTSIDENKGIYEAYDSIKYELQSPLFAGILTSIEILPDEIVQLSNDSVLNRITHKESNKYIISVGTQLTVDLYISSDMSVHDPYVIQNSTSSKERIIIIVNVKHPHWLDIQGNSDVILHFLKHCVLDGVAEWKAFFYGNQDLSPSTIKTIKDQLLRVKYRMQYSN
ncbi:hypothetical protein BWI93_10330 [Siphonobacter sp. BAB-5385]|uniref:ATP-binding protein n=1 Tax=Siphonobacter sp. BAB-5385 TaxID=1864822 RepID=UPI000B9EB278|nr:ATP-binding protein [Siphonobacter sp. BAB-5385]OZI08255.1 hypothetical protein BWI93_10330 [Siphonobacter sp. BAB-5385]